MTGIGAGTPAAYAVPGSAWLLGWACLASQLVSLADRGSATVESALLSVPLSALVVAWVSSGVLRARLVRTWFAGIILLLVALFGLVAVVVDPSPLTLLEVLTRVVAFGAFADYVRSDLFASLREDPSRAGPDLSGLVALAVLVGALGGLTAPAGPADRESDFHVWIGL
ncbi:MAG TPA: hypothetical protein VD864_11390 [Nocardioides sp.]|nr:hypothetical protein [Nocardioides sp.]